MSTISNERLEELANGDMEVWYSESQSMARELLALRKERERAEPVAYISKADLDAGYPHILARKEYSKACPMAVYSAPPAPVVADERAAFNAWSNEDNLPIAGVGAKNAAWLAWQARATLCGNSVLDVPVVPEEIAAALIAAIEKEQDRLFGQDYLMDSKDCIDVIREEMERLKVCRGAMLAAPGKEG